MKIKEYKEMMTYLTDLKPHKKRQKQLGTNEKQSLMKNENKN